MQTYGCPPVNMAYFEHPFSSKYLKITPRDLIDVDSYSDYEEEEEEKPEKVNTQF